MHIRWLIGSVSDWSELFRQAYRCLKPGGYIESQEPDIVIRSDDDTVKELSAMDQWGKLYVEGGRKFDRPFTVFPDDLQRKGIEGAGFVDVEERTFKVITPRLSWYYP